MKHLDPRLVLSAGGWDPRYAVTLAVAEHDSIGAALIDSNGDEADIDLDDYERDADGNWHDGNSAGVGDSGTSWTPGRVAIWGRSEPHEAVALEYLGRRHSVLASGTGWWLFVAPSTPDWHAVPRRVPSVRG